MAYRRRRASTRRMPKRKRSWSSKKYWKRRGQRVTKKVMNYIPDRMTLKLVYDDVILYQVPGGGLMVCVAAFKNSLQNPRIQPPGGHRPHMYAQWEQTYSKYRVYGIKYTIRVKNRAGIPEAWYLIARGHKKDNGGNWVPDQNLQTTLERREAKWKMGGSWAKLTGFMSVAKVAGVPSSQIKNEDDWCAQTNTDPVEQCGVFFYMSQNNASTQPFDINVRLTYYVEMFNRVSVGMSGTMSMPTVWPDPNAEAVEAPTGGPPPIEEALA